MNDATDEPKLPNPLPLGRMALDASAGTGKTKTVVDMVLRLIEEGVTLERIVVVTFTRAAADELRERLATRLRLAADIEDGARDGKEDGPLRKAVDDFDLAVIDTIHAFTGRLLRQATPHAALLGMGTRVPDLALERVDRDPTTTHAVAHDVSALHRRRSTRPIFGADVLEAIVTAMDDQPYLTVAPDQVQLDEDAERRRRLMAADDSMRHAYEKGQTAEELLGTMQATKYFRTSGRVPDRPRAGHIAQVVELAESGGSAQSISKYLFAGRYGKRAALSCFTRSGLKDAVKRDAEKLYDAAEFEAYELLLNAVERVWGQFQELEAAGASNSDPVILADEVPVAAALARKGAQLVQGRRRQGGVAVSGDLIRWCHDLLDPDDPATEPARQALADSFDAIIIDEAQDTDRRQFAIARALKPERLYLVGDAKQAIYGFRGGDPTTYADEREEAVERDQYSTLSVNHRSDEAFVAATNALFENADFGPDITFTPSRSKHGNRMRDGDGEHPSPLVLRWLEPTEGEDQASTIGVVDARRRIVSDVAGEIASLLQAEAPWYLKDKDQANGAGETADDRWRAVQADDCAVLVRSNAEAEMVVRALSDRTVPAALWSQESVFVSDAARSLRRILHAVSRPGDPGLARLAWAVPLLGRRLLDLRDLDDERLDAWMDELTSWQDRWRTRGVSALVRQVAELAATELGGADQPDRLMLDLLHTGELLQAEATAQRLPPDELLAWFVAQMRAGSGGRAPEAQQRRLAAEGGAVQVVTMHGAKGLQFPLVWCPFLWRETDQHGNRVRETDRGVTRYRGERGPIIDVRHRDDPRKKAEALRSAEEEAKQENARLLYVALTRARHRCVVHWGPISGAKHSALHRLMEKKEVGEVDDIRPAFASIGEVTATGSSPTGAAGDIPAGDGGVAGPAEVSAARLSKPFDTIWDVHSYSRLTSSFRAPTGGGGTGLDDFDGPQERGGEDAIEEIAEIDEIDDDESLSSSRASAEPELSFPSFPPGKHFGIWLHGVLEHLDFARAVNGERADLEAELAALLRRSPYGDDADRVAELTDGLLQALEVPLGLRTEADAPLRLRDVALHQRWDELQFDLPLGAGDDPANPGVALGDIAETLERNLALAEPATQQALRSLIAGARGSQRQPLRGFLTGLIDVVVEFPGAPDGLNSYVIIDYKTNLLPGGAGAYHPDLLHQRMIERGYTLQSLLYSVAVHRFLRGRLGRDYRPEQQLVGSAYLYLRGMTGATTDDGRAHGVDLHRWPIPLLDELDRLFDGKVTA